MEGAASLLLCVSAVLIQPCALRFPPLQPKSSSINTDLLPHSLPLAGSRARSGAHARSRAHLPAPRHIPAHCRSASSSTCPTAYHWPSSTAAAVRIHRPTPQGPARGTGSDAPSAPPPAGGGAAEPLGTSAFASGSGARGTAAAGPPPNRRTRPTMPHSAAPHKAPRNSPRGLGSGRIAPSA